MITVKQAISAASAYMTEIFGILDGPLVEEVELDERSKQWKVTMGFWQKLPSAQPRSLIDPLAQVLGEQQRVKRVYKELLIDADNGAVKSMKIRIVPSIER